MIAPQENRDPRSNFKGAGRLLMGQEYRKPDEIARLSMQIPSIKSAIE
jgi:hypothetical protein